MTEKDFKAMKEREDRKAAERWISVKPSAKQCKKCIHAYEDTQYTVGAEKANCYMFEPPDDKTPGILQDKIECPFFEEKEEE